MSYIILSKYDFFVMLHKSDKNSELMKMNDVQNHFSFLFSI